MSYTISQLAACLGLPYQGDGNLQLTRVSGWDGADGASLVFVDSSRGEDEPARHVAAGCVIAPPDTVPAGANAILSERPKLDFARAAALLSPRPRGRGDRHPTAAISRDAEIGPEVDIGAHTSVGPGAKIGRGSILHEGVVVGEGSSLGENCILHARVVLYPGSELGNRVILHAGVVIGGDGFGYVFDGQIQVKFPQLGKVIIEDDVEIGANATVDRGSLGITRVGAGAKIDNLVQIAHNVEIGRGVVIAAQTGISGSTVIEDYAVIGGQVGFGDHARVQTGAVIGSKAGVLPGKIVRSGDTYWGVPVRPLREYKRLNALFGRLPEMKAEIDSLKEMVARIWKRINADVDPQDQ